MGRRQKTHYHRKDKFHEFLQPVGLKAWIFSFCGLGSRRAWQPTSGDIARNQQSENVRGTRERKWLNSSLSMARRGRSWGHPSRNKGVGKPHFPPRRPSINTWPPAYKLGKEQHQHSLPNLITPRPTHCGPVDLPFPGTLASVLALQAPSPGRVEQIPLTPHLPTCMFYGMSHPEVAVAAGLFTCRPTHIRCASASWRPNTAHNRQREPLQMTRLKEKAARTKQQA